MVAQRNAGQSARQRSKKRPVTWIVAAVIVLVVAGFCTWYAVNVHNTKAHADALAACQANVKALSAAQTKFDDAVSDAATVNALKVTDAQVADVTTVATLQVVTDLEPESFGSCDANSSLDQLNSINAAYKKHLDDLDARTQDVSAAVSSVNDSLSVKELSDVRLALNNEIRIASALYKASDGYMPVDDTSLPALGEAIKTAQKVANSNTNHVDEVKEQISLLKAAEKAVSALVTDEPTPDDGDDTDDGNGGDGSFSCPVGQSPSLDTVTGTIQCNDDIADPCPARGQHFDASSGNCVGDTNPGDGGQTPGDNPGDGGDDGGNSGDGGDDGGQSDPGDGDGSDDGTTGGDSGHNHGDPDPSATDLSDNGND
jgi:hypothetical protein